MCLIFRYGARWGLGDEVEEDEEGGSDFGWGIWWVCRLDLRNGEGSWPPDN